MGIGIILMPEFQSDGGTAYYDMGATITVSNDTDYTQPEIAANFRSGMAAGVVDAAPSEQAYYIMDDFGCIRINDSEEEKTIAQLKEEAEWTL